MILHLLQVLDGVGGVQEPLGRDRGGSGQGWYSRALGNAPRRAAQLANGIAGHEVQHLEVNMVKKRKPHEEPTAKDYLEAADNFLEVAKVLAGRGGISDQDFLARMARSDDTAASDQKMSSPPAYFDDSSHC
jgi:hypothetical protein